MKNSYLRPRLHFFIWLKHGKHSAQEGKKKRISGRRYPWHYRPQAPTNQHLRGKKIKWAFTWKQKHLSKRSTKKNGQSSWRDGVLYLCRIWVQKAVGPTLVQTVGLANHRFIIWLVAWVSKCDAGGSILIRLGVDNSTKRPPIGHHSALQKALAISSSGKPFPPFFRKNVCRRTISRPFLETA